MSTILKALRRLEDEKASSGSRPLREEVATAPDLPPVKPERRWLPPAVVGVGLGLIAAVVWSQWPVGSPDAGASDVAAQPTPPAVAPAPVAAPQVARGTRPPSRLAGPPIERQPAPEPIAQREPGLPDQAFASPVKVVERPPASPRETLRYARASDPLPEADPPPAPPAAAPRAIRPAPARKPEVRRAPPPAALRREPAPPAAAPIAATPKPEPAPAPRVVAEAPPRREARPEPKVEPAPPPVVARAPAQPEPKIAKTEPTPAKAAPAPTATRAEPPAPASSLEPLASAPPAQERPALIRVEKTLWHPTPERRVAFVVVGDASAQRVQEGDVVGKHVVSEIQPSGVLFLDDGKPVHRKIGTK